MADRRRTFGPVVLLGLASAALAAVAGNKPWLDAIGLDDVESTGAMASRVEIASRQESPLAAALALVVLACWGVVLVTRGRFRRAVACLSLLAAAGLVATAASAPWVMADSLAAELRLQTGSDSVGSATTAWWWAALVAAVVCVATTGAAAAWVPHWPEMGSRYDAPVAHDAQQAPASHAGAEDNLDIWKALDEGRDPTA